MKPIKDGLMAILSLLGGNDKAGRVDSNAPEGDLLRDDAFNPKPAQEALLARVRRDAEAEALRHAEAIVNRDFPIVEEAESIGVQRIAALGAAYAAAKSRLDAEIASGRSAESAARAQLQATDGALEEQGVAAERLPLAPLGQRMASYWQVAPAVAAAAAAGYWLSRSSLSPAGMALGCLVALALVGALLSLRIARPESGAITSLRRNRQREARLLDEVQTEVQRNQSLAQGLVEESLRLVEAEVAFAKQLVAAFESAASSALPVGALGNGQRSIRKQREPRVPTPGWVRELEEGQ
jgi:hypothetical protein